MGGGASKGSRNHAKLSLVSVVPGSSSGTAVNQQAPDSAPASPALPAHRDQPFSELIQHQQGAFSRVSPLLCAVFHGVSLPFTVSPLFFTGFRCFKGTEKSALRVEELRERVDFDASGVRTQPSAFLVDYGPILRGFLSVYGKM